VVALAEGLLQALAHLHQHGIAGGMSVLVVDLLEVVDVDQEEDEVGVLGQRRAASAQMLFAAAHRLCHVGCRCAAPGSAGCAGRSAGR
jgi:hypothetical protein